MVWLVPGDRCVLVQLMVSLGQSLGFRAMAMEVVREKQPRCAGLGLSCLSVTLGSWRSKNSLEREVLCGQ